MEKKKNIIIIGNLHSHPSSEAFLQKFVKIVREVGNEIYVISGDRPPVYDNVSWINFNVKSGRNTLIKIAFFLINQVKLLYNLSKYKKNYDIAINLATGFIFPVLYLKLLKIPVALFIAQKTQSLLLIFAKLNFLISDILIVESNNVLEEWKIKKYMKKTVNGAVFVDDIFTNTININERENVVGYIGTLSKTKSAINFVEAIPQVLKEKEQVSFLIGGEGDLLEDIKSFTSANNLQNNIQFIGWIPHNLVPHYLNIIKIFILPSISEGLPNSMLESMSCGTPVLVNGVGGIPDIIKDCDTGFIMGNNSPECIAKNIIRILEYPKLEEVVYNANNLINKNYTFNAAVGRYRELINRLGDLSAI